ncbi:MAG TPA: hypothetical protein DCX22_02485 [Dehalococcoidia bacterium]|nr:hypothetical protein [Dehalococcoidia bacterium]
MIVHSIHISGWRCFADPVEINGFDNKLNVIHAPNGAGKSTILEALTLGMFDNHKVTGAEIKAIRPWGRMLSPSVIIEFSHKDVDYRISKTFLDGAKSLLERKEEGRYTRFAENDHADSQVRLMLTQAAPAKGLSRVEHWGLTQVLWASQGNLALNKLSGDVIADIRSMLGAQVDASAANPVERMVESLWSQYFTGTGKLRSGKDAPEIVRLKEKLHAANDALSQAREQQRMFDETSRRVEDLRARQKQSSSFSASIDLEINRTAARVKEYETLEAERKQREEQKKTAEAQYNALKQRIDSITKARKDEADALIRLNSLEKEKPGQQEQIRRLAQEAEEAKRALEDIRRERADIAAADNLWQEAANFLELSKKAGELKTRLKNIGQTQNDLEGYRKARAALIAPDKETVWAIGKAMKDRDEARVRIDASLITLEVVPERDISIDVISGESPGINSLQAGKPAQIKGSPEVVVDLPSIARIRAKGPTGSIEQYRKAHAGAEQRLKELTAPYGTTDLEALHTLSKQAEIIDRKIEEAGSRLKILDGEQKETMEQDLRRVEILLAGISERHPEWNTAIPDITALKTSARQRSDAFAKKVDNAERVWQNAEKNISAAEKNAAQISTQINEIRTNIDKIRIHISEVTADGKTDEIRTADMNTASLAWNAARISLEEIEKRLAVLGENPVSTLEKLEKQLTAAQENAAMTRDEEQRAEERLHLLSEQGTYTALSLAEEEVERLKRDIAEEELKLNAVNLIHSLLMQRHSEILADIAEPVETAASRILQRIAGTRLGRVKVNEGFAVDGIMPPDAAAPVSLDNASGGEQEQIYFAIRLALAEMIAGDERNLIVLDDVLAATDAGRLARIMTIIEETAQRMQVLIFTCHPERYHGLADCRFIDLEAVIRR